MFSTYVGDTTSYSTKLRMVNQLKQRQSMQIILEEFLALKQAHLNMS